MIKLFSLKQQKKDGESVPTSSTSSTKKCSPAQLRIMKDLNELNLPKTCSTDFPDPDDLLNFKLSISPDEGFYKGGRFMFNFRVGANYPHEPPKVKCETPVYHPNIDLEGNVCLNILREDWKPVLTINSIVYGLQYLFLEPNPEDPLNKEAADVLQSNRRLFESNVYKAMRGGYVGSVYFERCLKYFESRVVLSILKLNLLISPSHNNDVEEGHIHIYLPHNVNISMQTRWEYERI